MVTSRLIPPRPANVRAECPHGVRTARWARRSSVRAGRPVQDPLGAGVHQLVQPVQVGARRLPGREAGVKGSALGRLIEHLDRGELGITPPRSARSSAQRPRASRRRPLPASFPLRCSPDARANTSTAGGAARRAPWTGGWVRMSRGSLVGKTIMDLFCCHVGTILLDLARFVVIVGRIAANI